MIQLNGKHFIQISFFRKTRQIFFRALLLKASLFLPCVCFTKAIELFQPYGLHTYSAFMNRSSVRPFSQQQIYMRNTNLISVRNTFRINIFIF